MARAGPLSSIIGGLRLRLEQLLLEQPQRLTICAVYTVPPRWYHPVRTGVRMVWRSRSRSRSPSRSTVHGPRFTIGEDVSMTVKARRRNDLHKLDVYRCALELYRRIGRIVAGFPRGESDLRSQMRRAGMSVPFNIGEGVGKRGRARAAAYQVALGEAKELIVALDCVEIDGLAPLQEIVEAQELVDRIAAMLTKLIRSVEQKHACPICGQLTRS